MRYKEDLSYAIIHRNEPITKYFVYLVKTAFEINEKVFGRNPKKFKIKICDSDKEFKENAKYYYQKWATGTVLRDRTLVIRGPKEVKRIGKWKVKDIPNIVTHEMNHVFWQNFYGITKPVWLDEGFACCIGKTFFCSEKELKKLIKKHKINYSFLDYRYLKRKFKRGHIARYPLWAHFSKYMINKYSSKHIVKLMDNYSKNPNKKHYHKTFKRIFNKTEKQLFNEFLSSL